MMPSWLRVMVLLLVPGAAPDAAGVSSDLISARELPLAVSGRPVKLLLLFGPIMLRPDNWPEAFTASCTWPEDCCCCCLWSRLLYWS